MVYRFRFLYFAFSCYLYCGYSLCFLICLTLHRRHLFLKFFVIRLYVSFIHIYPYFLFAIVLFSSLCFLYPTRRQVIFFLLRLPFSFRRNWDHLFCLQDNFNVLGHYPNSFYFFCLKYP